MPQIHKRCGEAAAHTSSMPGMLLVPRRFKVVCRRLSSLPALAAGALRARRTLPAFFCSVSKRKREHTSLAVWQNGNLRLHPWPTTWRCKYKKLCNMACLAFKVRNATYRAAATAVASGMIDTVVVGFLATMQESMNSCQIVLDSESIDGINLTSRSDPQLCNLHLNRVWGSRKLS